MGGLVRAGPRRARLALPALTRGAAICALADVRVAAGCADGARLLIA